MNKSGIKTTEFGVTLMPYLVLAIKNLFGIELDGDVLIEGVLGLVALINTALYIWSRTQIKVANSNQMVTVTSQETVVPTTPAGSGTPPTEVVTPPVFPTTPTVPTTTVENTIAHVDNQADVPAPVAVAEDSQ